MAVHPTERGAAAGSLTWQQTCSAADPLVLERHLVIKGNPHIGGRLAILQKPGQQRGMDGMRVTFGQAWVSACRAPLVRRSPGEQRLHARPLLSPGRKRSGRSTAAARSGLP